MEAQMTFRIAYLVAASLTLAACATAVGSDLRPTQSTYGRDASIVTEPDIYASRAATAYQALERLRPTFLISKIDLAPLSEREVYLNGIRFGGIADLRLIPANSVKEIRFVRAIDGGGTGSGRTGAILVISKGGR
jgi:hypothetical protein